MLRNVLVKTLRDHRRSMIWWGVGIIGTVGFVVAVWPTIRDSPELSEAAQNYPDVLQALVGGSLDIATPEGYLGVELFSLMAPLILLIFAIGAGASAIAGEEEKKTIDILLANPISRTRLVGEKAVALTLLVLVLAVILWLALVTLSAAVDMGINADKLGAASASVMLLALHFGAFALLIGCLTGRRGLSTGLAAGGVALAYLVSTLATLVDWLEPYQKFSPYWHYIENDPLRNGLSGDNVAVLAGATVGMILLALVAFNRRDVAV